MVYLELHRFRFKAVNWMLALLTIQGGFAASDSFQSGLEDAGRQYACPGEVVNYTCTVVDPNAPILSLTIWRGTALDCPPSNTISLSHSLYNTTGTSVSCAGGAITAESVGVVNNCFTSRVMVTVSPALNGTTVECTLSGVRVVGSRTILISGPPPVPILSFVGLSGDGNGAVNVTVNWTLSDGADFYLISITTNVPQTPYGGLLNVTVTQHELTGFMAGYEYNITVCGVNCGSQKGSDSEPLKIRPQAPNPPTLTVIPLYDSSGALLEIESQATAGAPVTIANGVDSSPTEYIFSYNGSPISVSTGSTLQCTISSCQHTFRVTSSQSQQYTVSMAARNVVGVGNASTPVTVGSRNVVFNVTIDIGTRVVTCQFLNGPVASATCTFQYGTDPTYVNLPNTDSSTGTNVNSLTVPLSGPLQADTLYYYVVSSMGVRMQGTFHSGCTLADLGVVDTTADERCVGLQNSAQFPGGVVCYSGVTIGSLAVYICNSTHHLEGTSFRECQRNGNWTGTVPQCGAVPEPATAGLSVGAAVGMSITIFLVSFSTGALLAALITYCCCVKRKEKSSGQPHPSSSEAPQPAPLYDEVVAGKLEVKENVAYGPVDTLEMKQNPSYGPVRH